MISAMMSVCTICDFWDRGERGERGSGRILKKVWQSEWVNSVSRSEEPNCTQRMKLGTDNRNLSWRTEQCYILLSSVLSLERG
jgi:hypothetical protein